jgi:dGTPase
MYRHWKVNRSRSHAKRIIRELFELLLGEPELLPPDWQRGGDGAGGKKTARRVCDYIAGMTDDFCIEEHARLFSLDR